MKKPHISHAIGLLFSLIYEPGLLPTVTLLFLCYSLAAGRAYGHEQEQSSLGDVARQARAQQGSQSNTQTNVITNDSMAQKDKAACTTPGTPPPPAAVQDRITTAFLSRIAGRWKFSYVRKGNQMWYPDHGMAPPHTQVHYLFGPKELVIETRPEFDLPYVSDRFTYGPVRKISAELFDMELIHECGTDSPTPKRFKLSSDGKTLELADYVDKESDPTVQVLQFVDKLVQRGNQPKHANQAGRR